MCMAKINEHTKDYVFVFEFGSAGSMHLYVRLTHVCVYCECFIL